MSEKPPEKQPSPILVDSDWKSQAQAEKERLAEAEAAAEQKAGPPGAPEGHGPLPPADFQSLVGMLATQALMYMGGMVDRKTGAAVFDPEYAYHMVGLLGVLEEKTKGNLTEEEAADLASLVSELRHRYVEMAHAVARSAAAGKGAVPPGAGRPGGPGFEGLSGLTPG